MTKELFYIKHKVCNMGRKDKINLLSDSNLNNQELDLLIRRLVNGETLKDISNTYNLEEDTINKKQLKAIKKLYYYLTNP